MFSSANCMVEDKTQLGSKSQLYIFTDSNREEINQVCAFLTVQQLKRMLYGQSFLSDDSQ